MSQAGIKPEDIQSLADLAKMPFTIKMSLEAILKLLAIKGHQYRKCFDGTTGGEEIYIMYPGVTTILPILLTSQAIQSKIRRYLY